MRSIPGLCFCLCASVTAQAAGYVTLNNASYPNTYIEAGDTVSIVISGAASNGAITVSVNGGSPAGYGTTDGLGNKTIYAAETNAQVSVFPYSEVWYVNGVALSPLNNAYGPTLPSFYVYANDAAANCPSVSTINSTRNWIWSPVSYNSLSTPIVTAASEWNYYVGSTIEFTNDTSEYIDVTLATGTLPTGTLGSTATYGQDSNDSCVNTLDACGNCLTSAVMFTATVTLDPTQLASISEQIGAEDLTTQVAAHEFGHVLRLGHTTATNGTCSEVQSLMYPFAISNYECDQRAPTPYCDGTVGIGGIYPGPVAPFCDNPDPYCAHGACS